MMGNFTKGIENLVTAEEIVELFRHQGTFDEIGNAKAIIEEWQRTSTSDSAKDGAWDFSLMIGCIYAAGRIQGIREERAKQAHKIGA